LVHLAVIKFAVRIFKPLTALPCEITPFLIFDSNIHGINITAIEMYNDDFVANLLLSVQ